MGVVNPWPFEPHPVQLAKEMLVLFLVTEGSQLDVGQDLLPTSRVSSLYSIAERACGGEKVVLLSPSGHLLDEQDILASYDVGTEEKPVFVFFKSPLPWKSPPSLLGTASGSLEQQVSTVTASPSPSSLQRQIALAEGFVKESNKLNRDSQLLVHLLLLQRAGWRAALANSSAIVKSFHSHFKAFTKLVQNQSKAQPCYQELLNKFSQKLELLKRIAVPTSLNQSVFSQQLCSLYDWVSSQDNHSSLPELHKECKEALAQADMSSLEKLLGEGKLLSKSAQNVLMETELEDRGFTLRALAEKISSLANDQKSMADSLHSTVQRVLGSGDAGMLANISLSNVKLLQMMARNSQEVSSCVRQLELHRETQGKAIASGLLALTSLQRQMSEIDTNVLYYSELLHLTKRRFEILEQICAAPDVLTAVLNEINIRKMFKKRYLKEAQRAAEHFRWQRETEKARRQVFLEKCGQHFVLSLFPPLLDRPPHVMGSVPEHFDDDICALSAEDLEKMGQNLPNHVSSMENFQYMQKDKHTQTDQDSDSWQERVSSLTERVKELEKELISTRDEHKQLLAQRQSQETSHAAVQVHLRCPTTELGLQVSTEMANTGTITVRDCLDRETQTNTITLNNQCCQTERAELHVSHQNTQTGTTEPKTQNQNTQTDRREPEIENQTTQTDTREPEIQNQSTQTDTREPEIQNQSTQTDTREPEIQNQSTQTDTREPEIQNQSTQTDTREPEIQNQSTQTDAREPEIQNQTTQTDRREPEIQNQRTQTDKTELGDQHRNTQTECLHTQDDWAQTAVEEDEKQSRLVQTVMVDTEETGAQTLAAESNDSAMQTNPLNLCLAVTQTDPVFVRGPDQEDAELGVTKDAAAALQQQLLVLQEERLGLQQHVDQLQGQLESEQDARLKQTMELEREMKELQRSLEGNVLGAVPADSATISIGSLNVGDIALFMQDPYQNFLALTIDRRIYYLNHTSAQEFTTDLAERVHIPLKRKILLGRVTQRVLVEVKKESNRLNIPIGQRLYKVTAEEVQLMAAS